MLFQFCKHIAGEEGVGCFFSFVSTSLKERELVVCLGFFVVVFCCCFFFFFCFFFQFYEHLAKEDGAVIFLALQQSR